MSIEVDLKNKSIDDPYFFFSDEGTISLKNLGWTVSKLIESKFLPEDAVERYSIPSKRTEESKVSNRDLTSEPSVPEKPIVSLEKKLSEDPESIGLEDISYSYVERSPHEQEYFSSLLEFAELSSSPSEPIPKRGMRYLHQEFIRRLLLVRDDILLVHRPGTGKTCASIGSSEQFRNTFINELVEYVDSYTQLKKGMIKKVFYLVKGPSLKSEVKYQIACRCTKPGTYDTQQVLSSITMNARKKNLTRSIGKMYKIMTYHNFAAMISKLSDIDIVTEFSGCIFVIDEAHNVRVPLKSLLSEEDVGSLSKLDRQKKFLDEPDASGEHQRSIYYHIARAFFYATRCKRIQVTATPMVASAEDILPILNLLNLKGYKGKLYNYVIEDLFQMDWFEVTKEQLYPYINGKVSFVKELELPITISYPGTRIEGTQLVLQQSFMEAHQAKVYMMHQEEDVSFRSSARQASVFVYPDGSIGREGFRRYCSIRNGIPIATEEFIQFLQNDESLRSMSSCFYDIIQLLKNPESKERKAFFSFGFVDGGALPFALALQHNLGYDIFNPLESCFRSSDKKVHLAPLCEQTKSKKEPIIPKGPRVAVFTSHLPEKSFDHIMELYNSTENSHGEYLRFFIGSVVSRDGLNLLDTLDTFIVGAPWTYAADLQARSRTLRAGGFSGIMSQLKGIVPEANIYRYASYALTYQSPETQALEILSFSEYNRIVLELPELVDDINSRLVLKSTDEDLYQLAENANIKIKRIERMMKEVAIDCQVMKGRNAKRDYEDDGSAACDYQECNYACHDVEPQVIDGRKKELLFSRIGVQELRDTIISRLNSSPGVSIGELAKEFSDSPFALYKAISSILDVTTVITDMSGIQKYASRTGDLLHLVSSLELTRDTGGDIVPLFDKFYSSSITMIQKNPIDSWIEGVGRIRESQMERELRESYDNETKVRQLIMKLSTNTIISVVEDLGSKLFSDKIDNKELGLFSILARVLSNFLFYIPEINLEITRARSIYLSKKRQKGEVRLTDVIGEIRFDRNFPVRQFSDEKAQKVLVHFLANYPKDTYSHLFMTRFNGIIESPRILASEGSWRNVKDEAEMRAYNIFYQYHLRSKVFPLEQRGTYIVKTVLRPGMWIRPRLGNTTEHEVRKKRGKQCRNWQRYELLMLLAELNIQPSTGSIEVSDDEAYLITNASKAGVPSSFLLRASKEQLATISQWIPRETCLMCSDIENTLIAKGQFFIL